VKESATLSDEEFYRREFLERQVALDCPENGVNLWLPGASRRLWNQGYSDQEIFSLLYQATRKVKHRAITSAEIKRAITLVIGTPLGSWQSGTEARREPKPLYDPLLLARWAARRERERTSLSPRLLSYALMIDRLDLDGINYHGSPILRWSNYYADCARRTNPCVVAGRHQIGLSAFQVDLKGDEFCGVDQVFNVLNHSPCMLRHQISRSSR